MKESHANMFNQIFKRGFKSSEKWAISEPKLEYRKIILYTGIEWHANSKSFSLLTRQNIVLTDITFTGFSFNDLRGTLESGFKCPVSGALNLMDSQAIGTMSLCLT